MTFRFEKLEIWQQARLFSVNIYKTTAKFPREERFSLTDQLRRGAVSVAFNIAEGSDKKSDKEFVRFLRMAIGSLEEVVTGFYIAKDLNYLTRKEFDSLYEKANFLASKINALVNSINRKQ